MVAAAPMMTATSRACWRGLLGRMRWAEGRAAPARKSACRAGIAVDQPTPAATSICLSAHWGLAPLPDDYRPAWGGCAGLPVDTAPADGGIGEVLTPAPSCALVWLVLIKNPNKSAPHPKYSRDWKPAPMRPAERALPEFASATAIRRIGWRRSGNDSRLPAVQLCQEVATCLQQPSDAFAWPVYSGPEPPVFRPVRDPSVLHNAAAAGRGQASGLGGAVAAPVLA